MLIFHFIIVALFCTIKANEETLDPYDSMSLSPHPDAAKDLSSSSSSSSSSSCCGWDEMKNSLSQLIQEAQESRSWYGEIVKVLNQLVQENKEATSSHAEILNVLRVRKDQGDQELHHLQSMARLQSLLVENHQALLLQISRISTMLQDATKRQSE